MKKLEDQNRCLHRNSSRDYLYELEDGSYFCTNCGKKIHLSKDGNTVKPLIDFIDYLETVKLYLDPEEDNAEFLEFFEQCQAAIPYIGDKVRSFNKKQNDMVYPAGIQLMPTLQKAMSMGMPSPMNGYSGNSFGGGFSQFPMPQFGSSEKKEETESEE